VANFTWPYYGYDAARTKVLPRSDRFHPPYHRVWLYRQKKLLEFPPAIDHGRLYFVRNDGVVVALKAAGGARAWKRRLGDLAASTPAVGRRRVWVTLLLARHSATGGAVASLSERTGRAYWTRRLPSRAESSPLLLHRRIYFGSENGTVYALNARTGHTVWTYHAAGAVKAGLAYSKGRLYFGDYSGQVYAIRASDGHQVWTTGSGGGLFGRSGQFYSTPAVDFGRVYVGNTDGRVYSFATSTGQLAWAIRTSAYVYGSPAAEDVPGLGPTVYVGSYDGNFYAFNARSGAIRWHYAAQGKISGGSQIIGSTVYFADLGHKRVIGLGVKTGRVKFTWPDGAFNPVVADRARLYVIGFGSIYALRPAGRPHRSANRQGRGQG
jgi:outer membrane protein assembly factor BamB